MFFPGGGDTPPDDTPRSSHAPATANGDVTDTDADDKPGQYLFLPSSAVVVVVVVVVAAAAAATFVILLILIIWIMV
jgi:hypothetical protein